MRCVRPSVRKSPVSVRPKPGLVSSWCLELCQQVPQPLGDPCCLCKSGPILLDYAWRIHLHTRLREIIGHTTNTYGQQYQQQQQQREGARFKPWTRACNIVATGQSHGWAGGVGGHCSCCCYYFWTIQSAVERHMLTTSAAASATIGVTSARALDAYGRTLLPCPYIRSHLIAPKFLQLL